MGVKERGDVPTTASVVSSKFAAKVIARPDERGPWQSGYERLHVLQIASSAASSSQ
jgi:hypothetical protein